ncbi:MAG TPA: hypothetical protein VM076_19105 [Gemmatimonadaceae bacterium]|nr:hypothetical protein [Gemmatimonadaceae bacterium]
MTRRLRALSAIAALAIASSSIRAQEQPDRTLPAQLSATTRTTLAALIDSARVAGLPVDPLYSKVREGVFRSADDARLIAAVQRLGRDLGDARAALGDSVGPEEITAGANALRAGIRPPDLSRLRDARGHRSDRHPLTVALVVLADLATRGVPPSLAVASVNELVTRNVSDGSLLSFRQNVERDMLGGRSAASALDSRTKSMIDEVERRRP